MRELTMTEIEQFDFTGEIPALHVTPHAGKTTANVKATQPSPRFNVTSKVKTRSRLGRARLA